MQTINLNTTQPLASIPEVHSRPIILALGFDEIERESLIFWFSDIAEHHRAPSLVLECEPHDLPETVDQLGLVASVRACPPAAVPRWIRAADIVTLGSRPKLLQHLCSVAVTTLHTPSAFKPRLGQTGFQSTNATEWRGAIRALLDDPDLCNQMNLAQTSQA